MKNVLMILVLLAGLTSSSYVLAETPTQSLGNCLVDNLNGKERKNLAKWIFLSMATHPELKPYSNSTPKDKQEIDQYVGKLITRLLTVDCAGKLRKASAEDPQSVEKAFRLVGAVAMQELMRNSDVQHAIANYGNYVDKQKIKAVLGQK